jgi:hypothetical protein
LGVFLRYLIFVWFFFSKSKKPDDLKIDFIILFFFLFVDTSALYAI